MDRRPLGRIIYSPRLRLLLPQERTALFLFGPQDPLHWMHAALKVDLGFRQTTAAFWGTAVYAIVILVFGLRALRHHKSPAQQRRYWSLIGFQWLFLFGIPEIIAPLVIERPWKLYALSVPWPLSIWSLLDGPCGPMVTPSPPCSGWAWAPSPLLF